MEAQRYLRQGVSPSQDSQIFREIDYMMKFYNPGPKLFLAYDRMAFWGVHNKDLRLTFDYNIRSRQDDLSLEQGDKGDLLLDKNVCIMEIKTNSAIPLWLTEILSKNEIYPTSFSKYGTVYQQKYGVITMFRSIITDSTSLTYIEASICLGTSIVLGIIISLVYMVRNTYSKGFVMTLAMLPLIVQVVILMVNGNLGVGVAVMGAFSLVRFRSIPGTAREICAIFMSMAVGLATGTGYVAFAFIVTAILCTVLLLFNLTSFGSSEKNQMHSVKISIPEQLNINDVFNDTFEKYLSVCSLERVKTTNLGSLFELTYCVKFKDENSQKAFIDEIRTKNGNLPIVCSKLKSEYGEML
ncbi:MAG: VTC domain-containing protein [Acutalibacteraceae bacterium]